MFTSIAFVPIVDIPYAMRALEQEFGAIAELMPIFDWFVYISFALPNTLMN